ncbi:MAG: rhomboid family intramembrane serine protease [Clostridiaceae bacterium]|nr:rhomboid family intramembrane serine protease [Clostridiaceae bacterium]MBW4858516.1 rhomboid family intramembrane serine protease [Clostridiaceae bacterium]MBW4867764.1 rhomboid family intramembrane serine protease [Clostridiaceae bacterium]MBW4868046.1 rhomboid family intramembrane serine protease [Clostridiaceae bacterium]
MLPLRDTIQSRRISIATWLIIIINVLVFFHQITLPDDEALNMIYEYAFIPSRFVRGIFNPRSYIPLFTSMFMHGSFLHLISNMWSLWLFGDNVEDNMGPFRFILFYILTGLIAGFAHFISSPMSNIPTVGASGAIAGIMGAYFMMFPHSRIVTLIPIIPFFIRVPAPIFLFIWFVAQLRSGIHGNAIGGVAWWAHIFGFLGGVFLYKKFIKKRYRRAYRS